MVDRSPVLALPDLGTAHDYFCLAAMALDDPLQNVALSTFGEIRIGGTQMPAEVVAGGDRCLAS
jgi:hypothetical protein